MQRVIDMEERIAFLQQKITSLRITDTHEIQNIIVYVITLSQDILRVSDDVSRDEYISLMDDTYTNLMNKIDTFIIPTEQWVT